LSTADPTFSSLEGSVEGKPSSWRKAAFLRPFSAAESLCLGNGGSEWEWEWYIFINLTTILSAKTNSMIKVGW
jgi:hypothetical protein